MTAALREMSTTHTNTKRVELNSSTKGAMTAMTDDDDEFILGHLDMMTPAEIVGLLDKSTWQETILGIYQILDKRFRNDPKAQEALKKDLSEIDPGAFEFTMKRGQ
jgi:hypothetical protein